MARVVAPIGYDGVSQTGMTVNAANSSGCCGGLLGSGASNTQVIGGGPGFVGGPGQAGMVAGGMGAGMVQGGQMMAVQGPNGGSFVAARGGQAGVMTGGGMAAGGGQSIPVAVPPGDPCGCGPGASAGECAGACGGMETMCCEPAGGMSQVTWVQSGAGPYAQTTSYQYVGEGMGTYDRQVVVNWYGWRFRKCCLALLCLLLLPLLLYGLYLLFTDDGPEFTTTRLPTGPQQGPQATCLIYGDPHIKTFDGVRADYYTAGEYWIVRSATVLIQGQYKPTRMTGALSVTKMIAVSGPFIKGHKLIIDVNTITWDGKPVLQGFEPLGGHWHSSGEPEVYITYNGQGTVMQDSRVGKALHVVHVSLPLGIKMEVNRWEEPNEGSYINVRLTMSAQPNQDGHCGNFNGNQQDDERVAVRSRVGRTGVPQNELIFPFPKTPVNPTDRPDINDCPKGQLNIAMEKCKAAEKKFFPTTGCLVDYCFGHMNPHGV